MDMLAMMMQMDTISPSPQLLDHLSASAPPPLLTYNPNSLTSSFLNPLSMTSNMAASMREMIFRMAAMQPVHIDPESVRPPKRRNVRISKEPQSVAARRRRERISEKIRILQRLVPGGTKMDTASMLDEAIHYLKFLKKTLEQLDRRNNINNNDLASFFKGSCHPPLSSDHMQFTFGSCAL